MPAANARRLLVLLAALTALVVAAGAAVALAPAAHASSAQNRVRGFISASELPVGPAASQSSCSRQGSIVSGDQIVAGFCVAAESAAGGTRLFRAVENPEAADIAASGRYRPSPTGSEYKGFFETQAQAERFAGSMNAQGYAYDTITSGVFPSDLMSELPYTDLVGNEAGRAYLAPNESLSRIFDVQIH